MANPEDEFDPDFAPLAEEDAPADDFDPDFQPEAVEEVAVEAAPREWWEDLALGAVDGLTLNNAGELGGIGERLGNLAADEMDLLTGRHEIDGMAPTKSGEGEDWEALYQLARESLPGKIGHGAGLVNTGAALSQLAPGTVGGQAVSGGASGALSTGGDTDYDMLSTLIGGAAGAALGGLGGAVGAGADAVRRWLGGAAKEAPKAASWLEPVALPSAAPGATNADELLEALAFSPKDIASPLKAGWKLLAQGGVKAAQSPVTADAARGVAGAMAGAGPQALSPMLGATKAGAQDAMPWSVEIGEAQPLGDYSANIGEAQPLGPWTAEIGEAQIREKAYAGDAALNYGVQTVLSSGRSGLPPKAERDLTSALLAGDSDKFNAMNFKLQQRHPGYAKRLQDELNSLSEDIP
jgi:hypothetical protein